MAKAIHSMVRVLDEARSVDFYRAGLRAGAGGPARFRHLHPRLPAQPRGRLRGRAHDQQGPHRALCARRRLRAHRLRRRRPRRRARALRGGGPRPAQDRRLRSRRRAARALLLRRRPRRLPDRGDPASRPVHLTRKPPRQQEKASGSRRKQQHGQSERKRPDASRACSRAPSVASAALMTGTGFVASRDAAWALEVTALKPETMATLIVMARDIYPHDRLGDQFYAVAMKGYDTAEEAEAIEAGIAALDAAAAGGGVRLLRGGAVGGGPGGDPARDGGLAVLPEDPRRDGDRPLQPEGGLAALRLRGRELLQGRLHRPRLRRHRWL